MYDNLTLELLLSGSGKQEKEEFLSRTITNLTGEELKIITTYFDQDMSLHNTCEKLFFTQKHTSIQTQSYLQKNRAEST